MPLTTTPQPGVWGHPARRIAQPSSYHLATLPVWLTRDT